ncbi:hypothetical protein GUITHDRAFT_100404 [Guillardia theta CCMP2712]|uniref:AIR9-like A9 domain-containing protein n=4 Tax=Guillardia theta TaxID=55529 RepID=L1K0L7_GUITC|nr:hypothetical protein GUITHDRAFT_100404 [Guillardia theta CCMP2712]EKX54157.1 hypothetical protein GUITHDRAFT_100404 [Guillardia theta CCMP2712]|eukprot:XP_005841137.1 hypothetical protein GUITHDRAFT_100404 [Guillardia theta CCMP2712]
MESDRLRKSALESRKPWTPSGAHKYWADANALELRASSTHRPWSAVQARVDTRRAFEKKLNFSEEEILENSRPEIKVKDKSELKTFGRRKWRGVASLFRFSYRSQTLNRTRRMILQGVKEKAVGQIPVFAGLGTFTIRSLSLTSLKGMGMHAEVKRIYMQNNLLTSFEGWEFQPSLEELHAEENFLESFRGVCEQPKLESIWLQGNPITRCYCYRVMAICAFGKSLRYIDGQAVKKEEAEKAQALGAMAAEAVRDGWLVDTAPNPDAEFDLSFEEYRDFRKFATPLVTWAAEDSDNEREMADVSRQSLRSSRSQPRKLGRSQDLLPPSRHSASLHGSRLLDQSGSDDESLHSEDLQGERKRVNVARLLQVLTSKSKMLEEQLGEQLKSQVETLDSIRRKPSQGKTLEVEEDVEEDEGLVRGNGFTTPERNRVREDESPPGSGSALKRKVEARRKQEGSDGLSSMLKEWSSLKSSKSSLKSCLVVEKSPVEDWKDGRRKQRNRLSWSQSPTARQPEAARESSWLEEEAESKLRSKIFTHGIAPRTSRGLQRTVMEIWSRVLLLKQRDEATSKARDKKTRTMKSQQHDERDPSPPSSPRSGSERRQGEGGKEERHEGRRLEAENALPNAGSSSDEKQQEGTEKRKGEKREDATSSRPLEAIEEPRREKSVQARRREIEERLRAKLDSNRKGGERNGELGVETSFDAGGSKDEENGVQALVSMPRQGDDRSVEKQLAQHAKNEEAKMKEGRVDEGRESDGEGSWRSGEESGGEDEEHLRMLYDREDRQRREEENDAHRQREVEAERARKAREEEERARRAREEEERARKAREEEERARRAREESARPMSLKSLAYEGGGWQQRPTDDLVSSGGRDRRAGGGEERDLDRSVPQLNTFFSDLDKQTDKVNGGQEEEEEEEEDVVRKSGKKKKRKEKLEEDGQPVLLTNCEVRGELKVGSKIVAFAKRARKVNLVCSFQWYRVRADGGETLLAGQTKASYVVVEEDAEHRLKVVTSPVVKETGEQGVVVSAVTSSTVAPSSREEEEEQQQPEEEEEEGGGRREVEQGDGEPKIVSWELSMNKWQQYVEPIQITYVYEGGREGTTRIRWFREVDGKEGCGEKEEDFEAIEFSQGSTSYQPSVDDVNR